MTLSLSLYSFVCLYQVLDDSTGYITGLSGTGPAGPATPSAYVHCQCPYIILIHWRFLEMIGIPPIRMVMA